MAATGICGFLDWTPEEQVKADRELEERRNREEQEAAKTAETKAGIQRMCDFIDNTLTPHLHKQLEAENATVRVSSQAKADFKKFRERAEEFGLPSLPAPPQAVAIFLADGRNAPRLLPRLAKSISTVHRAVGFPDPLDDILCRAILRQAREEESSTPEKQTKGNT
jgi:hypothetical protein